MEDPAHRFVNREPVPVFGRVQWEEFRFRELAIHAKEYGSIAAGVWGGGSVVEGRLRRGGRGFVVWKGRKHRFYMSEELSAATQHRFFHDTVFLY